MARADAASPLPDAASPAARANTIGSADVIDWLAEAAGARVAAKDFRTWHASVQALELTLAACAEGAAPCRPADVLAAVARRLGNKVAYVRPAVAALGTAIMHVRARAESQRERWVGPAPRVHA